MIYGRWPDVYRCRSFALFLIIDAILYSFESALKNINEKEIDENHRMAIRELYCLRK